MLTVEMLKKMEPDTIFAEGEAEDSPGGLFMANTGKMLRWLAVRGEIHDWAIYCHFADKSRDWIRSYGDKVYGEEHIRKLVPCEDEAFGMYRY